MEGWTDVRIDVRLSVCRSVNYLRVQRDIVIFGAAAKKEQKTDLLVESKGVFGGPSGPSREGPGIGHKIVSDTKQMIGKKSNY